MSLLTLYVPRDYSFFSTKVLVQILNGWFVVSSNKFDIFWYSIIILYCYINLRSSIVFCLCLRDICLSLSISSSFVSELFIGEVFEILGILSAI